MRSGTTRLRKDELAPALFPFLAVMVCTIGALVFILTIAVTQASQAAQKEVEEARVELQAQNDYVELATVELHAQREELQSKINRAKNNLTHLEDHIQRLRDELFQAQSQLEKTLSNDKAYTKSTEEKAIQIEQLQAQVASLEQQLTEEVEKQKTARPAFSIIPYAGRNGTARRPIYLECTSKGVVIQPEGILLSLEDLKPPHSPGNPLDAALRSIRLRLQEVDGSSYASTPYPLLLVRPDGIAAYALARSAMTGWEDQQGYELIDQDMPLAFPPSIPGLGDELNRVITDARKRQKMILASLPRNVVQDLDWSTSPTDLAIEHGDSTDGVNGTLLGDNAQFIAASGSDTWSNGGSGGLSQLNDGEMWPALDSKVPVPSFAQEGSSRSDTPFEATSEAQQVELKGSESFGSPSLGDSESNMEARNSIEGASAADGMASSNGPMNPNSINAGTAPQGSSSAPPNASASQQQLQAGANTGLANQAPVTGASMYEPPRQVIAEEARKDSVGDSSSSPQPTAIVKPGTSSASKQQRKRSSIASEFGEDWAVQRSRMSDTPIHRTISIRVTADRWLLVDDQTKSLMRAEVKLADGPKNARQQLRSAIEDEVKDWGVAVSRGYWVPVIKIYSDPQTEWATQQLLYMLEGSGAKIEIQK